MASISEFESLDEEVKELLNHYKHKRATTYEPCTRENFKECLIGLSEELGLLNISYIFNPYIDVEKKSLRQEALVNLINAAWTLLHHHKNVMEKTERLTEQNHSLEQSNKQLNAMVSRLKDLSSTEKNEARACIASAQRISDHSDQIYKQLVETRAKLTQVTKQKETSEKSLHNQIARLKSENEKLTDRLRNKSIPGDSAILSGQGSGRGNGGAGGANNPRQRPGYRPQILDLVTYNAKTLRLDEKLEELEEEITSYSPCSDVCDSTLLRVKERERKQRAVIAQLQANNQELLREIIAMKEELILGGLRDMHFEKGKK